MLLPAAAATGVAVLRSGPAAAGLEVTAVACVCSSTGTHPVPGRSARGSPPVRQAPGIVRPTTARGCAAAVVPALGRAPARSGRVAVATVIGAIGSAPRRRSIAATRLLRGPGGRLSIIRLALYRGPLASAFGFGEEVDHLRNR